jgi:Protein of unknown function (DUF1552)
VRKVRRGPFLIRRRDALRAGAATLFVAPFLQILAGSARAAQTGAAQRLLVVHTPNGTIPAHWTPAGSGASYSFPAGSILEPLAGLEPELLVLAGMDFKVGDNHEGGMINMLTAGGPDSIDQVVADVIGTTSRFKSLELSALTSAWGGTTQTRMAYRLADDTNLTGRRLSVLDRSRAELAQLHSRLGAEERARLDAHLTALDALERSLTGVGSCDQPVAPNVSTPQDNDQFPAVVKAQLDLAVQALACGATNVVSVQLSHTVSPVVFTWLGESDTHHGLSHSDDANVAGVDSFVACERWYAEQFRALVDGLLAMPDPVTGAPLLDSTVVLWAKELGDSRMHVCQSVPWVLAGSGNGFFDPGRLVNLAGITHDQVLTSIANAFGSEIESFGIGSEGPAEVLR